MKNANPLIIGPPQKRALAALRDRAATDPMDVHKILELVSEPNGMVAHLKRMSTFTIPLPIAYVVTFSIETGHSVGMVRHMSMSSNRRGKAPTPEAVWMVAEELGFVGSIADCRVYLEPFGKSGKAVNIVQPVNIAAHAGAA